MIANIGYYSLFIALLLSFIQCAMALWVKSSKPIETVAFFAFGAIFTAFAALIYSFAVSDFSVVNVTLNSQQAAPLIYKIAAAWGSHEGSMLLWVLLLSTYNLAYIFSKSFD